MDRATKTGIWIIATGVIIAFLYLGRSILAPFALAVFLFLVMEGLARAIDVRSELLKRNGSRAIAVVTVLLGFVLFIALMTRGIAQFSSNSVAYERDINAMIANIWSWLGQENAPTLSGLAFGEGGQRIMGQISGGVAGLSENLVMILLYTAFLFVAQAAWPDKLDIAFPETKRREQLRLIGDEARRGIETYLWTQTVISALTTIVTYATLVALGVDYALFLAAMIFVLNYIPTIGSIIAGFIPFLFALVQPDWPAYMPDNHLINAVIVLGAVSFWQFVFGNFLQPRMMGDSLNLSALVVLLSLSVWGAIWGIPGMFLSAPLTVLMMLIFAQSDATRWIAVLLSANGKPELSPAKSESVTETGDRIPDQTPQ